MIKRQLMHSIITSIINDGLLTSVVNKISYTIHKIQHTITHIQKERENKIVKKTPTQTQPNKQTQQTNYIKNTIPIIILKTKHKKTLYLFVDVIYVDGATTNR